MADVITSEYRLAAEPGLRTFVATVLEKVGVPAEDAAIVADVLVAADLRGVESHGVARLESYYVSRIRAGQLDPKAELKTVRETPTSVLTDAGNGLGHPAGHRTMERVLDKAAQSGAAFGAVRNSNHFGIAGYYAMLALDRDMIGIASTNSVRYGAPTFGRDIMLGTNPLAFAIPAKNEPAFVLDFATTTVPKGKLEVYNRKGKQLNPGWAIDANGHETLDPQVALKGALLPLGGYGVDNGGHKGYGLGLLVDILCGVLVGRRVRQRPSEPERRPAARQDLALLRGVQDRRLPRSRAVQSRHGHRAARVQGLGESAGPRAHLRRGRDRAREDAVQPRARRAGARQSVGRPAEARRRARHPVRLREGRLS